MKGISPIVAVVILLALAVTIGVLVSIWVTSWISTQRESEEFGCAARTRYIMESTKYIQSESVLRFRITNKGDEGIYGFDVVLYNDTMTESFAHSSPNVTFSANISETNKLAREESVYMSINISGGRNMGTTLTQVKVKNGACGAITAIADFIKQE